MLGELFTISAINLARAAVRAVEQRLDPLTPVDITIGSRDPDGSERLFIRVGSADAPGIEIDVDDEAVRVCLDEEGSGATHRLVDGLAREIVAAVREALRA